MHTKSMLWKFFSWIPSFDKKSWILILCYHSIEKKEPYITVLPEKFYQQIEQIKKQGLEFLNLHDVIYISKGAKILKNNGVLLTFDDAYADYWHIAKYLDGLNIPSVLGVIGNVIIGKEPIGIPDGKILLDKNSIECLSKNTNITILPHGMTHNPLNTLSKKQIHDEIKQSSNLIADITGVQPKAFICPFGAYNTEIMNEAVKNGFEAVLTIDGGIVLPGINNYDFPRYCINSFTKPEFFSLLISNGLPTYIRIQKLVQLIKERINI